MVICLLACGEAPPDLGPRVPVIEHGWVSPPVNGPTVTITDHDVRAGDQLVVTFVERRVRAQDKVGGRHGYLIARLPEMIRALPAGRLVISIDPATPYRTACEVIYSIGQAMRSELAIAVRQQGASRAIRFDLPRLTRPNYDLPQLNLQVSVGLRGLTISGSGGTLTPDCTEVVTGDVVTVPRARSQLDLEAMQRCLARVRAQLPDENRVLITGDPATPFDEIAQVMVAARGTPARPLYPDVTLAASR
jgi:biopolymer transport protein ExbD